MKVKADMTRVLLITDSEKAQRVFKALEKREVLQLRSVGNLMQADPEIAEFSPDFVFVQSRMSGLSLDIMQRHLAKIVPADVKMALLTVDADDATAAKKFVLPTVDLSEDEEPLADDIVDVLQGAAPRTRKKEPTAEAPAPARGRAGKPKEVVAPLPPEEREKGGVPQEQAAEEPETEEAPQAEQEWNPAPQPEMEPETETKPKPQAEPEPEAKPEAKVEPEAKAEQAPRPGGTASFEEMMRRAAGEEAPAGSQVEDRVEIGSRVREPRPTLPETLREGESRKRPLWLFALIVALLALPLLYYATRKSGPRRPGPVAPKPALPPAAPAHPVAPATSPPAAPVTMPSAPAAKAAPAKPAAPAAPTAKPAPRPPAAAAPQPAAKQGLKELPPFLAGVRLDGAYARTHPGWQRYLGARADYKLYKEGDVYRAIQVIALPGQTVPEEIFQKVLHEFGGIERYQVQSTEQKQHYIVEHCVTPGKVGLTIYRKISDRRMKGFVLFYR